MSLVEVFGDVDDFCQLLEPRWNRFQLSHGLRQRTRNSQLSLSAIMIHFHQSGYRFFKTYYQNHVQKHLAKEFPHLVSYPRFMTLMAALGFLFAVQARPVYRHFLCGCYAAQGLSQQTHCAQKGFCGLGRTR